MSNQVKATMWGCLKCIKWILKPQSPIKMLFLWCFKRLFKKEQARNVSSTKISRETIPIYSLVSIRKKWVLMESLKWKIKANLLNVKQTEWETFTLIPIIVRAVMNRKTKRLQINHDKMIVIISKTLIFSGFKQIWTISKKLTAKRMVSYKFE